MSIVIIFWFIIVFILAIIPIIFLIQVLNDQSINNNSKIFWVLILLFGNLLGVIIYVVAKDKNILK